MGQGAQQQQQGGGDNSLAVVWVMVLFMLTAYFIWYKFHAQITGFIFKIKLFEAHLIGLFTSAINPTIAQLRYTPTGEVSWDQMVGLSTVVGDFMRYPILVILILCAYLLYSGNPITRYRRTLSMKKLADQEHVNWPQICPVLKLNLVDQDIDTGPWSMAMSPMIYARKHKLIKRNPRAQALTKQDLKISQVVVIRSEAKKVFSLQMKQYWQGIDTLPVHTKALLAALAAKINRDRDGCNNLLQQINRSTLHGKLDFSGHMQLLQKYYNTKDVVDIMQKHAYVLTMMASMIEKSRDDGVMPTSDFLWLKPVDRSLWYMLNCVGRQTPYVEVSGPFAHWLAEKELGHRVMVPVVEEAVNALELAVKEVKLSKDELDALAK